MAKKAKDTGKITNRRAGLSPGFGFQPLNLLEALQPARVFTPNPAAYPQATWTPDRKLLYVC
jgi:hypothetical protein